jgi:hypothetical protein
MGPFPLYVRRTFFDAFAIGAKTIEYRLHRGRFAARTFWPGREVSIRYRYDATSPRLVAHVAHFEIAPLAQLDPAIGEVLASIYPDIADHTEIALIHLALSR